MNEPLGSYVFQNWLWSPIELTLDIDLSWESKKLDVTWVSPDRILKIINGVWFITKGVRWNGMSGVPDGKKDPNKPGFPITWKASLIHDLGCRYWNECKDFPYKRSEIDKYFRQLLKEVHFEYSNLYWFGVMAYTRYIIPVHKYIIKL